MTTITITGQRQGNNILKATLNNRFAEYETHNNGYIFYYNNEQAAQNALKEAHESLQFEEPDYEGMDLNKDVWVLTYDDSTAKIN